MISNQEVKSRRTPAPHLRPKCGRTKGLGVANPRDVKWNWWI